MANAVRVVIQVYDPERRGYRDNGMSIARIQVNQRELRRLWRRVTDLVEDRLWTDRAAVVSKDQPHASATEAAEPEVIGEGHGET